MSTNSWSYRLRPNKYVDRELFAEFVSLLVTDSEPGDYVYISMGGNHLSDHLAIYRRAGLRNLYAFDWSGDVVDRQKFNAPFDGVVCETHSSGELPALFESIIEIFDAEQAIVWLDYTEKKRLEQLREIEALASKLQAGDILKVTMNADFSCLHKREVELSPTESELPIEEKNVALLKLELDSYVPSTVTSLNHNEMPVALAKCIERACVIGMERTSEDKELLPILLTKYRDTTEMLTVTAMVADGERELKVPKNWPYAPSDWSKIEKIYTPELSTRERLELDRLMHKKFEEVQTHLGFHLDELDESTLKAYLKFHRFHPTFQAVVD